MCDVKYKFAVSFYQNKSDFWTPKKKEIAPNMHLNDSVYQ